MALDRRTGSRAMKERRPRSTEKKEVVVMVDCGPDKQNWLVALLMDLEHGISIVLQLEVDWSVKCVQSRCDGKWTVKVLFTECNLQETK